METLNPFGGVSAESQLSFASSDHKRELIQKILYERFPEATKGRSNISSCCGLGKEHRSMTDALSPLAYKRGQSAFPDFAILRVTAQGKPDQILSIVNHKEHINVTFMFGEDARRAPNEDRLMIYQGILGSFPNFIFSVDEKELPRFVESSLAAPRAGTIEFTTWIQEYGVSRNRADFWQEFDSIQDWFEKERGMASGLLDLSKYEVW